MISVLAEIPRSFSLKHDGIVICFNDEHPRKAYSSILVTDVGIDTCERDEHPENT